MEFENMTKTINQPDLTDIHRTLHPTNAAFMDFPNAYEDIYQAGQHTGLYNMP